MRWPIVFVVLSYAIVQFIALFAGVSFLGYGVSVTANPSDVGNAYFYFAYILVSALVLLVILKYYKGKWLFYFLELLIAFITVQLLASIFFNDITSLALGIAAVVIRILWPPARTPLTILSSGAIGALLGASFTFFPALVLSVLLAGYDLVAVFGTKHMVTLAKELGSRDAAFSLEFGQRPKNMPSLPATEVKSASKRKSSPLIRSSGRSKPATPSTFGSYIQLGAGDLVVPAILTVSALGEPNGLGLAVSIALGSLVGLMVLFEVMEHKRGYWPALPPLIGFSLIAAAVYLFLPF